MDTEWGEGGGKGIKKKSDWSCYGLRGFFYLKLMVKDLEKIFNGVGNEWTAAWTAASTAFPRLGASMEVLWNASQSTFQPLVSVGESINTCHQ